jgi:hypothetical protein
MPTILVAKSFVSNCRLIIQKKVLLHLILLFAPILIIAQTINDEDELLAIRTSKKYKDADIVYKFSGESYSFDKGKNPLGDKVVTIEEGASYEYVALKNYVKTGHYEYYNKFISIKNMAKLYRTGSKYVAYEKGGFDVSVTGDDVFFDDSRMKFFNISMDKIGEARKVDVKRIFSDGKYLTRLFFHSRFPTAERKLEFKVPNWLKIDFIKMNFEGYKINATQSTKGDMTIYEFTAYDLPPVKSESYQIGKATYLPHIILQIKSFEHKGETIKGFDDAKDVYAWNNRLYKMHNNDIEKIKPTYQKIIAGKTNDLDKIKAIYYWVQDNIRYIAYEDGYSGYIPASVQEVLTNKYGDCKGMANLLTELLKLGGFDARFSWVGTRSLPYSQTLPALCVNNHAITTLYYKDKKYFLDGTESYAAFSENAFRIQGKEVMVSNGDNFEIITVPITTANESKISTKADLVLKNNTIKGMVKVIMIGDKRKEFHQVYQELASTEQKTYINDYLEFDNENVTANNVKTSNLDNREINVSIEGEIDFSNAVNVISNDIYVGIDFFPKSLEGLVPDEKRENGYDLDDVVKFEDEISLTAPVGTKFVDVPTNLIVTQPGYEFKGEYLIVGNKLTLKKTLSINNNIIKVADFANWKKFIESIKEFNSYLISITKK